jgi:hypothetical protein
MEILYTQFHLNPSPGHLSQPDDYSPNHKIPLFKISVALSHIHSFLLSWSFKTKFVCMIQTLYFQKRGTELHHSKPQQGRLIKKQN